MITKKYTYDIPNAEAIVCYLPPAISTFLDVARWAIANQPLSSRLLLFKFAWFGGCYSLFQYARGHSPLYDYFTNLNVKAPESSSETTKLDTTENLGETALDTSGNIEQVTTVIELIGVD